ncbi:hypothetical protein [Faecalimicrobium sp. JNUCC 81]
MKRDIKINFGVIDDVIKNISDYYDALSDIDTSLRNIKRILGENTGKSIDSLTSNYDELTDDIEDCKSELSEVRQLLSNYLNEMGSYIQPVYRSSIMQVDRNDVWANLHSIENSVMGFVQSIAHSRNNCAGSFTFDEDKVKNERANYEIIEEINSDVNNTLNKLNSKIDELWNIYNNKIVPFENTDDAFRGKAKETYFKIAGFGEIVGDFFSNLGEFAGDTVSGLVNSLLDLAKGVISLVKGTICYLGSAVVLLVNAPFGNAPSWAKDYFNNTNNLIENILNDPMIIVEGISQEVSDTVDQKGVCYSTGYVVGMVAGTKGIDKITKATKGLISSKKSSNINVVDDIVNQASNKIDDLSSTTTRGTSGAKNSVDDIINGVEKGDIKLTNNIQKGNYGEMKMDSYYKQRGYERISLDKVSGLDDVTHQGIDGVYYNPDGHPPYVISEAKYGSSKLGMTNDGKQMSSNWIDNRLDNAVGKELADKIRMESILNPDNVQSQLIHVTPEGSINKSVLDEFAKKIK